MLNIDGYSQATQEERSKLLQSLLSEVFDEGKIGLEKFRVTLGEDVNLFNKRYLLNWVAKMFSTKNRYYFINKDELVMIHESPKDLIIESCIAENPERKIEFDRLIEGRYNLKTNTSLQIQNARFGILDYIVL